MKIFFDNVNLNSRSGPNSFGRKLKDSLEKMGHDIFVSLEGQESIPDIQLSFIASSIKIAPLIQRLDGIYFNVDQDFNKLNDPIKATYLISDGVIFQSEFNKKLTTHYFESRDKSYVIRNGTDISKIMSIVPMKNNILDNFESVWSCASSWRPHKRLSQNIQYFLDVAPDDACLVVAGNDPDVQISHPRVFYAGGLDWETLISLYRRSSHFIHLAWLDHCPNVVVDARAAGCHIVCSSSGGTSEISGKNSTIVVEDDWDFSPVKLYSPPEMDFSNTRAGEIDNSIDITDTSKRYLDVFKDLA